MKRSSAGKRMGGGGGVRPGGRGEGGRNKKVNALRKRKKIKRRIRELFCYFNDGCPPKT